ncbi:DMT family transporter [Gallaecimonas sp. GXIMD4217]|uniref:DMT family transporter n=1 Tax=Gallaecimonas sp. GXIMD4217 TaxID=3131927 RepID=UPI00311B37B1
MSDVARGALLLALAELCFAAVSALVKGLADDFSQPQLVFFRSLLATLMLLPWAWRHRQEVGRPRLLPLHLLRAIAGIAAMYAFFYAIAHLKLAQAVLVLLVAPFFMPVIARLWLGEGTSRLSWLAMAIGFTGVALILKPWQGSLELVLLIALAAAVLVALTKVTIRRLTREESPTKVVFYFSLLSTLIALLPLPLPLGWQPGSPLAWAGMLAMGLLAGLGQILMTRAFALASPGRIGALSYLSVLYAAGLGWLLWQEGQDALFWLGAILITWGGLITTRQRLW